MDLMSPLSELYIATHDFDDSEQFNPGSDLIGLDWTGLRPQPSPVQKFALGHPVAPMQPNAGNEATCI